MWVTTRWRKRRVVTQLQPVWFPRQVGVSRASRTWETPCTPVRKAPESAHLVDSTQRVEDATPERLEDMGVVEVMDADLVVDL
jgi:hypothetical protein